MKKLAFEYAGSFNMPSMKMVKIERENVMFVETPGTVYTHNGGSNFSMNDTISLALGAEIDLASSSTSSPVGSAV